MSEAFVELPVSIPHAVRAGLLRSKHRDPFERMLIAQALVEALPVVSNDKCFDEFDVERLW
jgi:PIN domain nuclease of toxin-antitoxin system